jgi:hypothetical protein
MVKTPSKRLHLRDLKCCLIISTHLKVRLDECMHVRECGRMRIKISAM